MKKTDNFNVGGVSNSPPTLQKDGFSLENVSRGKFVMFDWFQCTFDFIPVEHLGKSSYSIDFNNHLFYELLKVLKKKEKPHELEYLHKGKFNFTHGLYIDEHIWLSYGGNKTANDTYPISLAMSGQGCRVFEQMGGDWKELFSFFLSNKTSYLKIGRVDVAIDDLDGFEITPYEIKPYIEDNSFISPMRSVDYRISTKRGSGYKNTTSDGFTITLGKQGGNQLQIYDKNLERKTKGEATLDTEVWYRYEMRFTEVQALEVIQKYNVSVENHSSHEFLTYAKGLLKALLDIKVYSPTTERINDWNTLPAWDLFLDSVEKIDIKAKEHIPTTIEKKIKWIGGDEENPASLNTTMLELLLLFKDNTYEQIEKWASIGKFEKKHLNRFNNYLRDMGLPLLTMEDVMKVQNKLIKKHGSKEVTDSKTSKKKYNKETGEIENE